jgi:hypothetical protein
LITISMSLRAIPLDQSPEKGMLRVLVPLSAVLQKWRKWPSISSLDFYHAVLEQHSPTPRNALKSHPNLEQQLQTTAASQSPHKSRATPISSRIPSATIVACWRWTLLVVHWLLRALIVAILRVRRTSLPSLWWTTWTSIVSIWSLRWGIAFWDVSSGHFLVWRIWRIVRCRVGVSIEELATCARATLACESGLHKEVSLAYTAAGA